MRTWRFGLAVLILLAMVGTGAANLVRVARSADGGPLASTVAVATQPDGPLTMEAAYITALAQARAWSSSSVLMFASLQADWPLDPQEPGPAELPPGGWVRFAFLDGGTDGKLLSIVIERYSGEIVTAESQRWDSPPGPSDTLPVARTPISSERAVQIAEQGYGQAFRLACPIERHETGVTLVSVAGRAEPETGAAGTPTAITGTPVAGLGAATVESSTPPASFSSPSASPAALTESYWLVTYRDGSQPGVNTIEMEIDAGSGVIRSIRDRSQGCSDVAG